MNTHSPRYFKNHFHLNTVYTYAPVINYITSLQSLRHHNYKIFTAPKDLGLYRIL
jgi:hypothetical protein